MNKKYKTLLLIVVGLVFLDQATKLYIDSHMKLHQSVEVIKNFFQITYIRNSGAAFGILSGFKSPWLTLFFMLITVVAAGIILFYYHKTPENQRLTLVSFALIISGAIGNFIDRVFYGEVIDFLYFHWYQHYWPAFNVADSCITIGVSLLLWKMFFPRAFLKTRDNLNLSREK
ncbi:MAG: signal peptidase II [Nitrospinota bacterium]